MVLFSIATANFAQSEKTMNQKELNQQILVAYFSATGNTTRAAQQIAHLTGGELYAITPALPYTASDLDWRNEKSRSSAEMSHPKARPELGGKTLNVSAYDVIFIGYPIWWNQAPRIINTFIESYDWKGKILVPFATSGSSTIENSIQQLKQDYPNLNLKAGKLLNHRDEKELKRWIGLFLWCQPRFC